MSNENVLMFLIWLGLVNGYVVLKSPFQWQGFTQSIINVGKSKVLKLPPAIAVLVKPTAAVHWRQWGDGLLSNAI